MREMHGGEEMKCFVCDKDAEYFVDSYDLRTHKPKIYVFCKEHMCAADDALEALCNGQGDKS